MKKVSSAAQASHLQQIPNIGPALAADLQRCGIGKPEQLRGQNPYSLYDRLCERTGVRHDPCVIDTFIAAVRFMEGAPPTPWWHYTEERKATLAQRRPEK